MFFAGLLALSCIDLELQLLPKKIVYPLSVMVTALLVDSLRPSTTCGIDFLVGVLCALGWFLVFFLLNLASPKILGFGDVRLAPVLGIALGWLGVGYAVLGFFAANVVGAVVGLALMVSRRMTPTARCPMGSSLPRDA